MITERLMKLGTWTITLSDPSLRDEIEYFEHVVILPAELRIPALYSDASLLDLARYTGVIRTKRVVGPAGGDDTLELSGHGLEGWLGDEGFIGEIIEAERSYSVDSMANVLDRSGSTPFGLLRDAAGAQTAIHAGTLFSVAGTYTGDHRFVDQRSAIRYVVDLFSAEYRVNPDFTLDAGLDSDLFVTGTPTAILARKITDGRDPTIDGVPLAQFESLEDVKDYTTRVVLLAEGSGELLQTGSADAGAVPFKDPFDADVVRVRMVNEAATSPANANSRAQLHLNRFASLRQELTISTKNFDVEGTFEVGDLVYVWDPTDDALVDTANEVRYRGAVLNPIKIRVLGQTFPITEGMAVFIRHSDGSYLDVTDLVKFEEGDTSLEVGENPRTLSGGENGQILSGRINTETNVDDGGIPDVPAKTGTPWPTASYVDGEGRTRAQIATSWTQPLNTDASTITDGSHYSVRWRRTGETDYQYSVVDWGTTAFLIQDLASGVTYEISIAAVDHFANSAGYGTDESVVAQGDTIAPSTPAAPTVAGSPLALQISHDLGKASGGTFNLESDLDHLKVYVSTSSGFTPSEANRAGEIPATNAHLTLAITVIRTFEILDTATRFVKVTAVDGAGNESPASGQASVTADLIDTQHVTDLAVTNAKIGLLAVDTAQIALLAVDTAQIEALAVTEAKIDSLAVTNAKIGLLAVDTAQIANAAIEEAKIDNLAVTSAKIASLVASKITAGTIGVHVIKLSNSASSRIESFNGTSLIIRGNGTLVATSATITGAITATSGAITGALTVAGSFNLPSSGAANRIRIIGGTNPDLQIQSSAGVSQTNSRITLRTPGGLIGAIYPARASTTDFVMIEAFSAAEYLYLFGGGTATSTQIVGVGRRTGDVGIGASPTTNAIGLVTKGTGDTPVSIWHNTTLPAGGTHVVIQSQETDSVEFHLKLINRVATVRTSHSFRMDGRAEADGGGKGWFTTSDERLKTGMRPVDLADMIERIRGIPILSYIMRDEKDAERPRRIGPTAQGVAPHFPNSVSRSAPDAALGLETNETVWGLVAVVQDLLDEVDELKTRLPAPVPVA